MTSFAVTVAVARAASLPEFGAFAVAQVVVFALVQAFRSTVGSTILTGGREYLDGDGPAGVSCISAALVGAVGVISMLGYLMAPADIRNLVSVCGLAAAGLLIQERLRVECYVRDRPDLAASSAAITAAGTVLANVGARWCVDDWLAPFAALGVSAGAIGLFGAVGFRVGASIRAARNLWRQQSGQWRSLGGTYISHTASWSLVPFVVSSAAGLPAAGALRGAQAVAAVPQQVPQGLQSVALRRWSAEFTRLDAAAHRQLCRWNLVMSVVFLPVCAAAPLVPPTWGQALLGDTWQVASPILLVVLVSAALAQVSLGVELQLRVVGSTRWFLMIRSALAIPTLLFCWIGARIDDERGAALGLLLAQALLQGAAMFAYRVESASGRQANP